MAKHKMVRVADEVHAELYEMKRRGEDYGEVIERLVEAQDE